MTSVIPDRGDQDLDLEGLPDVDELDVDLGDGSRFRARAGRMLAAAFVTGAALMLVVNALTPSTLVDTTDRDEPVLPEPETDEPTGGGPTGEAEEAAVLEVEGGGGSMLALTDPADRTSTEEADAPADGSDAEAVSATGGAGTASADGATTDAAPTGTAGGATATGGDVTAGAAATSTGTGTATGGGTGSAARPTAYASNLDLIKAATVRNRNHDDSRWASTPSAALTPQNHYGPRQEYLGNPAGHPEQSFPVPQGGQFRTACEFSHFSYDDPLVFPGRPGASHLHMHFGNTDVNAFSTFETLFDSGSSTCNGQELNRTGYWVPAMFDGQGNVRIPNEIVVYYKGEGLARGNSEVYPAGAAMIVTQDLNNTPVAQGGVGGKKLSFLCTDNFSTNTGSGGATMPDCNGNRFARGVARWTMLEMNVKFPQCWNGQDPSNPDNFSPPAANWYGSNCTGEFSHTLPNLEYFVNYRVEAGESTRNWYLSSDIDPTSFGASKATGGSTLHGDWWGGWHSEINRMWIDNCVNYKTSVASGCGRGYLTDGGPNNANPYDGPALKIRPQYTGPIKVPASQLFAELCPAPQRGFTKPEDAAYCAPGTGY